MVDIKSASRLCYPKLYFGFCFEVCCFLVFFQMAIGTDYCLAFLIAKAINIQNECGLIVPILQPAGRFTVILLVTSVDSPVQLFFVGTKK